MCTSNQYLIIFRDEKIQTLDINELICHKASEFLQRANETEIETVVLMCFLIFFFSTRFLHSVLSGGGQELALGPRESKRCLVGDPQHLDVVPHFLGDLENEKWNMEGKDETQCVENPSETAMLMLILSVARSTFQLVFEVLESGNGRLVTDSASSFC